MVNQQLFTLSLPISMDEIDNFFDDLFNSHPKYDYPLLTSNQSDLFQDFSIRKKEHFIKTDVYNEQNPVCMKNTVVTVDTSYIIPQPEIYSFNHKELLKPSKTDLYCWWCCNSFDTILKYTPINYNNKKEIFKVKGVFCSYSCSYAFTLKDKTILDKSLLKFMYKVITGKKFENIKPAPPKEILKVFGGSKTIEEFRSYGENVDVDVRIITYPLIYASQQIETREIESLVSESVDKVRTMKNSKINIKRETSSDEPKKTRTVKPKDKKPVVNNGSLETLLGIISEE